MLSKGGKGEDGQTKDGERVHTGIIKHFSEKNDFYNLIRESR